jgi:hypothetical protein
MADTDDHIYRLIDNDDDIKSTKTPAIADEEDVFSGDATSSESPDIDKELEKVGLKGDENGIRPLDVNKELEEEDL